MKKNFALISEPSKIYGENTPIRELFKKNLKNDYFIDCFSWNDIKKNHISKLYSNNNSIVSGNLNTYDAIYLTSLGEIEGKENKLLNFINNLKSLESIVMNNPKTMSENFDKKYLLNLQSKGISVIPTIDVTNWDYDKINSFNFKGYNEILLKPKIFGERMKGIFKIKENPFNKKSFKEHSEKYGKEMLIQPLIEDITKYGERSLIFVGDNFSHAIYRHREEWNKNNPNGKVINYPTKPTKNELKVAENILSVWTTEYNITRFDFITDKEKPMISEVEMINPNLWLGKYGGKIDNKFINLFKKHLDSKF